MESLRNRGNWEDKQRVWYDMLRDGLPRRNKPFPGAANLHLPLADNAVEKTKPYYTVGIFSRRTIATFISMGQDMGSASAAAEECHDWHLRHNSNYPLETCFLHHYALGNGRSILKTAWDHEARGGKGRLKFDAIDPLYFIGQAECSSIDDMDLFCHIKQISVERYKRTPAYVQDEDLIQLIRGGDNQASLLKEDEKEVREGLTSSADENIIILWETWERTKDGYIVRTFNPGQPDRPVRDHFRWPLEWQGEPLQPFVEIQVEVTEKGWYAPRGITEKVAPFESYGTKLWNQEADWLEYAKSPLFTRDLGTPVTNTNTIRVQPGQMMPPGVKPFPMPEPPFKLDDEINRCRALAEESAQVPDFGVTPEGESGKESRTATEVQYIGSFASQGIQYKVFLNGLFEAKIYKRTWAMIVMWGGDEVDYFAAGSRKVLPEQAKHDKFLVEPNASPNSWDQQKQAQRAVGRFQMFMGHPNINQEELVKTVLEADDPRLVKRLFISTSGKAASERDHESQEIGSMLDGYLPTVMPGQDHVVRLQTLFSAMQRFSTEPQPVTPREVAEIQKGSTLMKMHVQAHLEALQAENPAKAKEFQAAMQALDPAHGQAPGNVSPMPGPAGGPAQLPAGGEPTEGPMGLPGLPAPEEALV